MPMRQILGIAAAILIAASAFAENTDENNPRRIAIWGSSAANGTGDELWKGGYAGRLKELLESRGWEVFNQSHPGDNTTTIQSRFEPGDTPDAAARYLTVVDPDYVVIGLSLGNDGIAQCQLGQTEGCTRTATEAEAVFERFASGLQQLITRVRAAGMTPVVTLPYARLDFSEREYGFTRRMNLLINSWDVPSVNLLGAIDDGQGRWGRGLWADPFHPNAAGHEEMMHAFVPSLFAALDADKATPRRQATTGYARVRRTKQAPMTFRVDDTMRSHTLTFMVRPHKDGVVAEIVGRPLNSSFPIFRRSYGAFEWDTESLELTPSDHLRISTLEVRDGRISYDSSNGNSISSRTSGFTEAWHYVSLSHSVARAETTLFIDGELVGSIAERLQPESFALGGPAERGRKAASADYREWMLHRASLNADEAAALHAGVLLQASLELYAPLTHDDANLAQSLSTVYVDSAVVDFMTDGE